LAGFGRRPEHPLSSAIPNKHATMVTHPLRAANRRTRVRGRNSEAIGIRK